jgi:hypothetical protein
MQNFRSQILNLRQLHDDKLSRHFKRLSTSKQFLKLGESRFDEQPLAPETADQAPICVF